MPNISLPRDWTPRWYQLEAFKAFDSGVRFGCSVWHRRSGKDSAGINKLGMESLKRSGNYWHLFPTARQGRKALWDSVDRHGRRVIDQAVPEEIRDGVPRQDEMLLRVKGGSTIQVCGADQADSLVGSNPVGVVMSEYALTSPRTINFIMPILIENGGWLWINSTPRGKNHLYDLYHQNIDNPDWKCTRYGWKETGFLTQADIDLAIRSGMPPEIARQEFECSWDAPNIGVVYARQMDQARNDGRITSIPHDSRHPVETWWDIGHRDATAIWFVQRIGDWINVIDYVEERGKDLPYFANELTKRPYAYNRHVGPHDLENMIWGVGTNTTDLAASHGIQFTVAPKLSRADGIAALRAMFSKLRFDAGKCNRLVECLDQYQYKYDEELDIFTTEPVHDWSSHGADAGRYGAVTPQEIGMIPQWAQLGTVPIGHVVRHVNNHGQLIGHNGGPPLDLMAEFDPLGDWRGRRAG